MKMYLHFVIKSDAAFGSGNGIAGIIDNEVQYDDLGCPFLSGKEIKGILVQECAGIIACLPNDDKRKYFHNAASRLFGKAGSKLEDTAWLVIGNARLPDDLIEGLKADREERIRKIPVTNRTTDRQSSIYNEFRSQVLNSLTTIRQQTAIDNETGVAKEHSLRATRVIIRETPFTACLDYRPIGKSDLKVMNYQTIDLALLAACVAAFRRAGTKRNRGYGRLEAQLCDDKNQPVLDKYLAIFAGEVRK